MKTRLILIVALLSMLLASVAFADPERIVSLGPALTKQLYLLSAEDSLVGVTTFCQLPQASEKQRVGTLLDANIEKIVQLDPDLILATSLTSQRDIGKLRSLGIEVLAFPKAGSFAEICAHFLELAKYLGKEKQAAQLVSGVQAQVEQIKEKTKHLAKVSVFIQVGAKPLFTVSADSFFNDLIEFSGGINIAQDTDSGLYSRERVFQGNPDVIIVTTMGLVGEEEKAVWQNYPALNAVQAQRIYIVDEYQFCSMTPEDFLRALEKMVEILHQNAPKSI
ncbi:helical backbone metal receptor [Candidatus Omnitrophota bacterium]